MHRARGRPPTGDPSAISTELLLDTALDAFAERGYEGTSVREIARALGVSHNLIPQRIGTKEDLWRAAVDFGFARLASALATVTVGEPPTDDVATLRALVVRFVEANGARPSLLRIIRQEGASEGPRFDHLFDNYIDPVRLFGQELLTRLHSAGKVRTDSVALMYFFMAHGAGGPLALPALAARFGMGIGPDDPVALRRHAERAADLLFEGLLVHPPDRSAGRQR